DETPFGGGEIEEVADGDAEREEVRQDPQHQRQAFDELLSAFEAEVEGGNERDGRRRHVMQGDQVVTQGKMRQTRHSTTDRGQNPVKLCGNPPLPLITHLQHAGKRVKHIQEALSSRASPVVPFSTNPPATPTPSTYIQPS